ncbi:MAG: RND family efflux transporter MFP subunit [Oceanicoccus sp.]|jgi:RND family efflux transporter MFP subunit
MPKFLLLTMMVSFSCSAWSQVDLSAGVLDCILQPNTQIDVASPVEGVVENMWVKRGDRVKKGQPLMQLRSEIERSTAKLAGERAAFNRRTVNRNDDLSDLISDQEQDEIITDAKVAELELEEANTRLAMRTTRSPIDGWVIETLRSAGEFVTEEPFLTIVSIDPLYVEVIAPVSLLGEVKLGDIAKIKPEEPIKESFDASVIIVDPVVDPASGTFRIRLELPNPDDLLPSGLKCSVDF